MLDLAKQCKGLSIYTHVSTCYVNCEKMGFIEEKIYEVQEDSEVIVSRIMSMSPEEQDKNLPQILGPWPNTYTFTKSMAERTLKKKKPLDMPCLILRPSIIQAAIKEPLPGWTDTLSAAGGLGVVVAVGLLEYINSKEDNVADIVPVDYVSNAIIVGTALEANKPGLSVCHSSTSHSNPITWGEFMKYGFDYFVTQPMSQQLFRPRLTFIQDQRFSNLLFYLRSTLPVLAMEKVSKIPGLTSPAFKKNIAQLKMVYSKLGEMTMLFEHFTSNQWIYENKKIFEYDAKLSAEERQIFYINPREFDWEVGTHLYAYGVETYINKEDKLEPDGKSLMLLHKNKFRYFDDVKRAFLELELICVNPQHIRKDVLSSRYITDYVSNKLSKQKATKDIQTKSSLMAKIEKIVDQMQAEISPASIRLTAYFFLKVWDKLYEQIVVNQDQLNEIKKLIQAKQSRVVLLPTHKSFMDLWILGFIHVQQGIEFPFTCGSQSVFKYAIIQSIMKKAGTFRHNPENQKDAKLYEVVLSAYLTALFKQNTVLEMFLESHRSRSGKIQRSDEAFFDTLVNTHLQENQNKQDLIFVPVTINYDRVIEGEILPLDLLGESVKKDSAMQIFKSLALAKKQQGKVFVRYSQPISFEKLSQAYSQKLCMDFGEIVKNKDQFALMKSNISQALLFAQVDNLVIMTTSIVAALILMNRKGIAKDLLVQRAVFVYEEILERGGIVQINIKPNDKYVTKSLSYLSDFLEIKNGIVMPNQQQDKAMKSVMMLTYYRNHLVHLFITDAEIASVLFALKHEDRTVSTLFKHTQYLKEILNEEFVLKDRINSQQQFAERLDFLSARGFFSKKGEKIHIENDQQSYKLAFLCSLIHPYVDTYAITLAFFSTPQHIGIAHDEEHVYSKLQWVLTIFYQQGVIPHSESCMIESIRNAVRKFKALGILSTETVQVKKTVFQHFVRVKKATQVAQQDIQTLYEGIAQYTATPIQNYVQIQTEIKKLTVSELIARL
ncbi:hypothetical protein FGO68_gene11996 [Halteria grandinella]|uniref:Phospholipid/glycerol acyltransferase domain-containing protein n=1 Tax=Halteria grandinella TaxID=5974 RepID=A0A8J8T7Q5_HALGN|nr:hypothetical protein FGO68_gene11996 [Halteria grandinella]